MTKIALCIILLLSLAASTKVNLLESIANRKSPLTNRNWELSMFYCGFGDKYCGQSSTNDINIYTKYVILAFLKTNSNGSVTIDVDNFPNSSYKIWKNQNKLVLISVGARTATGRPSSPPRPTPKLSSTRSRTYSANSSSTEWTWISRAMTQLPERWPT